MLLSPNRQLYVNMFLYIDAFPFINKPIALSSYVSLNTIQLYFGLLMGQSLIFLVKFRNFIGFALALFS